MRRIPRVTGVTRREPAFVIRLEGEGVCHHVPNVDVRASRKPVTTVATACAAAAPARTGLTAFRKPDAENAV